jgi:hypothetical protein
MCLGHIIFQAFLASQSDYGRALLPDGSTAAIVLQYTGFQRYVSKRHAHFFSYSFERPLTR